MSLTSLTFLVFCILVLIIYFIAPKKFRWIILLASSVTFLFWDNFSIYTVIQAFLVLLAAYTFGILIEENHDTKKAKLFCIIGVLFILAQLIYLKYTNLFLITANHIFNLFNININFEMITRDSLIGISYYSLIMISYLIDVYRGTCKPQRNIFKCALFMSYFPILTSGPFIRYENMEKDLYEGHKLKYDSLCKGIVRILWGVFKILVISQRCGFFVDTVYGDLSTYNGCFTIIAVLLYTIQLYTNFSGSIDIIIGISEIIGINLPENFKAPFFSKTITEFWRNWHITLGAWLRDYIFYPLQKSNFIQNLNKKCKKIFGKKVGKKIPLYLSMFIMWILIGIWHGGAYTFIIASGIFQFVYIVLEDILGPISAKINKKIGINTEVFSYKLYQIIRTFALFSFSMIFFRAATVGEAAHIIKSIFVYNPWVLTDNTTIYTAGLDIYDFRVLIISIIVLFIVDWLSKNGNVREKLFKQNIVFRWGIIYVLIFSILVFGCYGVGYDPAAFIYRQF